MGIASCVTNSPMCWGRRVRFRSPSRSRPAPSQTQPSRALLRILYALELTSECSIVRRRLPALRHVHRRPPCPPHTPSHYARVGAIAAQA